MYISKKVCNLFKKCEFGSDDWIVAGCKINGLFCNSEGYNLWIEFSKQDPKYKKEECDKYWEIFTEINTYDLLYLDYELGTPSLLIESSSPDPIPDGW